MKIARTLLLVIGLLSQSLISKGADFSYVFIQGDKKTPIYTKVEGVMMPRYGKNYALLAPLAPGPMNLEILFQQNEHPPLHFHILVPENGKRAFLLSKKDGKFALYDIQQNFYLQDDNALEDDHMPVVLTNQALTKATKAEIVPETPTTPVAEEAGTIPVAPATPDPAIVATSNEPAKTAETGTSASEAAPTDVATDKQPEFIEGITFDNERKDTTTASAPEGAQSSSEVAASGETTATIINSDCTKNIASEKYYRIRGEMRLMTGEDQRLGAIEEAVKQHCFSTKQAGELTALLTSDIAKLSALKSFYPKITDQSNYAELASLISDADTRNYFLSFLKK